MKTKAIQFTFLLPFILLSFVCQAQKTGNIVEIFGKEKVESTKEGQILHTFRHGLVLRNGIQPGLINGANDIVVWQLANGSFRTPVDGSSVGAFFLGEGQENDLIWESTAADSNAVFSDKLTKSVLYTAYNAARSEIVLLEATGHTRVFINGLPHEGDHYDYGYTLIPFRLKKGQNEFLYSYGRFSRYSSRLVVPSKPVFFTHRDPTLPSLLRDENQERFGAIRVVNATEKTLRGYRIECVLPGGEKATAEMGAVISLTTRKVAFRIPAFATPPMSDTLKAQLILKKPNGKEVDRIQITLKVSESTTYHERSFVSRIDGSVQYFSVAPSLQKGAEQALVLSVHGASVEAANQARAYKQKDWAFIIAPTNRRPFGFNWEEWGRKDALEVLAEAKRLFKTNLQKTFLTGHSMGGHGSWFLGATYPGFWGTVSPCAGYPDVAGYRKTVTDQGLSENPHFRMLERGASAGRVFNLTKNYLQAGVYILHGGADAVVPVDHARTMRALLGTFHPNFAYYEYPGGSHWYSDESVDWPPLFDFMKQNPIPETQTVDSLYFATAAPVVSSENHWVRLNQQEKQYETSSIKAVRNHDTLTLQTVNLRSFSLLFGFHGMKMPKFVLVDGQEILPDSNGDIHFIKNGEHWSLTASLNPKEKNAQRQGGLKMAFDNQVVFVYATHGSREQNEWYENKARFDAETFLYRGNASVEIIPDRDFSPGKFTGRNVILYGNADNNSAWVKLLGHCPVKVNNHQVHFGGEIIQSERLGAYFVYPRADDDTTLVGVIAGTGNQGMKALAPNDYFSGITGFPDLLIFDVDWLKDNPQGIWVSGFFGNDWSINNGEFAR